MSELVLFSSCALLVLVGALGVVLGRNPVHCALFLLMTLVAVAVLFLLQHAALVAIIQIVVYASAIVVLFLFVITLLGVDQHEVRPIAQNRPFQLVASVAFGILVLLQVVVLAGHHWATGQRSTRGALDLPRTGNVERLARSLFTDFVWPFEITAVLLVIAVVGGVVLARRSGQRAPAGRGTER